MKMFISLIATLFIITLNGRSQELGDIMKDANMWYNQKQFQKAALLYKGILKKFPDNLIIQYNLGNASFKSKNYNEAINAFEKAARSSDKKLSQQSFYNLGVVLAKRQRLEESVKALKNALLLDSNDKAAKENLQLVLNWLNNQAASKGNSGQSDSKEASNKQVDTKNLSVHQSESAKILNTVQKEEEKTMENQKLKIRKVNKEKAGIDW